MSTCKHRNPRLWMAGFLVLGLCSVASAADSEGESALPGTVLLHATSSSLGQALDAIDTFVQACVQGTPIAGFVPAGQVKRGFFKDAPIPMEIVDKSRPVHIIISNPKFLGAEPPVGFILPINGFAGKIALLKEKGYEVSDPEDGVYGIKKGWRTNLRMLPVGDTYVIASEKGKNADSIKQLGTLLQTAEGKALLNRPGSTKEGAPIISAVLDIKKLLKINEAGVNALIGIAKLGLDNEIKKGKAPPIAIKFMEIGPKYVDQAVAFLRMIDRIGIQGFAGKDDVRWQFSLTPTIGSKLATITDAYHKDKAPHALVGYLPKGSAFVEAAHIHPTALTLMMPFWQGLIADVMKALGDEQTGVALSDAIAQMVRLVGNDAGVAIYGAADKPGWSQVQLTATKDATAYMQAVAKSMKLVKPMMEKVLAAVETAGETVPFALNVTYEENAGKVEGVSYSKFGMTIEMKGDAAGAMGAQEQAVVKKMMDQNTMLFAAEGNIIITASGPNREAELAATIKSIRAKAQRIGTDPAFAKRFTTASNKQVAYSEVNVINGLRLYIQQISGLIPGGMGGAMLKAMKGIADGASRWTLTVGTKAGATAAAPTQLVSSMTVPAKSVQELIAKGQQFQMQMMQAMMQNQGGDAPPPDDMPEEPLEEF